MKEIPSCPNYYACADGHVWRRGRRLKVRDNGKGYLKIAPSVGGKQVDRYVHRLVCEAYHGACPEGMQCRHINGNRADNKPSNLAWGTPDENVLDRIRHGSNLGERNGSARLTREKADQVRRLRYEQRLSYDKIAEIFGVSRSAVRRVVVWATWNKNRVSGEFLGETPEKWSERLDSNQRPLTPQESPDA